MGQPSDRLFVFHFIAPYCLPHSVIYSGRISPECEGLDLRVSIAIDLILHQVDTEYSDYMTLGRIRGRWQQKLQITRKA